VAAHRDRPVLRALRHRRVVLGGTSLSGGRGTIIGTLIGAFVIGILNNGLTLMGISSFLELIITGTVIVLALIIDQLQQRAERRLALQQQASQIAHQRLDLDNATTERRAQE
jgi:predicted lipid-binding transport protein (Tim44 family)